MTSEFSGLFKCDSVNVKTSMGSRRASLQIPWPPGWESNLCPKAQSVLIDTFHFLLSSRQVIGCLWILLAFQP